MEEGPADPMLCVLKWIDYTNRYGFGVQFSDGTISVSYCDGSILSMKSALLNIIRSFFFFCWKTPSKQFLNSNSWSFSSPQLDLCQFVGALGAYVSNRRGEVQIWRGEESDMQPPNMEGRLEIWRIFWQFMDMNLVRVSRRAGKL